MALSVAIAGASGYVGGELIRLIAQHPELELKTVTANTSVGKTVSSSHPAIKSYAGLVFQETTPKLLSGHDVIFLALPHTKSAEIALALDSEPMIIDCSADFRLQDGAAWTKYYGTKHAGTWAYGLPEVTLASGGKLRGRLREQHRIAIPGCNVTAVTLALAPALTAGLIEPSDIVSVLSVGTSGAGKKLSAELLASEVLGSSRAYGIAGSHRHTPEIEQNLGWASGGQVSVSFTPVLVPMKRGILAVNTALTKPHATLDQLREVYEDAYGDEQFVNLLPLGELPRTASVEGSNLAEIAIALDDHTGRFSAICAIDNLVKGTAGAAIQSMNIAKGFVEHLGLNQDGLVP